MSVKYKPVEVSFAITAFLLTCFVIGCQARPSQDAAPVALSEAEAAHKAYVASVRAAKALPDTLPGAASQTYAAFNRAYGAGETDHVPTKGIPALYWAKRIQKLQPIRVYTHRVNLVVMQRQVGQTEEGLYIRVGASSYIPIPGHEVDGFILSQVEPGVFKFTRERKN